MNLKTAELSINTYKYVSVSYQLQKI